MKGTRTKRVLQYVINFVTTCTSVSVHTAYTLVLSIPDTFHDLLELYVITYDKHVVQANGDVAGSLLNPPLLSIEWQLAQKHTFCY